MEGKMWLGKCKARGRGPVKCSVGGRGGLESS